jgi:4-phytase/acid phosphatase
MKHRIGIAPLLFICLVHSTVRADVLKQVVIVTRHGVRAPTWTPERLNQYSSEPWPDFGVPPGYLTPHGRKLMKLMGDFYRELYAKEGLLGERNCSDAKQTFFWADTDQRTIESAKALAESIVPGCPVEVHSKPAGSEDPLFDAIGAGVAKPDVNLSLAAVQGRIGPSLDALLDAYRPAFEILDHVLNGNAKASKSIFDEPIAFSTDKNSLSMTGPLALSSTFTENLLLEYTNGMNGKQFGWGRLTSSQLQQILVLHTAYAELMRRTPYVAKGRGSFLLNQIAGIMEQTVSGERVPGVLAPTRARLIVLSGHDTNISNLSGLLGLSWVLPSHAPDDAPPGGALIFSLWKTTKGIYKVKVQFVAQTLEQMHNAAPLTFSNPPGIANLFVAGCSTSLTGYPCSWSGFKRVAADAIEPAFVERKWRR